MKLVPIAVMQRARNSDGTPRVDEGGRITKWPEIWRVPEELWEGLATAGHVIRKYGGWHVDHAAGFAAGFPAEEAVCLVPPAFARAMLEHVDSVLVLTEAEAAAFCDERCFPGRPVLERNSEALRGLLAERELRLRTGAAVPPELEVQIDRALDPDDPEPGVRRAARPHSFAALKERLGAEIVAL